MISDLLDNLQNFNVGLGSGNNQFVRYLGIEDFADRLGVLSAIILLLGTILITSKTYIFTPIACYCSTPPGGSGFDDYASSYCWVTGTIPYVVNESLPTNKSAWMHAKKTRGISYYQWVPFILALLCILNMLPRFFWLKMCYNGLGTDFQYILSTAGKVITKNKDTSAEEAQTQVADMLSKNFLTFRDIRSGRKAKMQRKLYKFCSWFITGKRMGNRLVIYYFVLKIVTIVITICQMLLLKYLLGFKGSMGSFGNMLINTIEGGFDWQTTLFFARVAFCPIHLRHIGVMSNIYVCQCTLPINMLNEKIFIFLWFWFSFVLICLFCTVPLWFIRMVLVKNQRTFVRKYLKIKEIYKKNDATIQSFISDFLRQDGVFILRMITLNCGDVATAGIIQRLFKDYQSNYSDRNFAKDIPLETIPEDNRPIKVLPSAPSKVYPPIN